MNEHSWKEISKGISVCEFCGTARIVRKLSREKNRIMYLSDNEFERAISFYKHKYDLRWVNFQEIKEPDCNDMIMESVLK
jgi:hypothetical protein